MVIGVGVNLFRAGILGGDAGVGLGVGFFPGNLFLTGAQGAWYDPSDYSTLFQNSIGTTPVTAVEQPVRLMLDRSRGLVLGGELVTNGDFSDGTTTGWTAQANTTLTVVSGAARVANTIAAASGAAQTFTTVSGRSYRLSFNLSNLVITSTVRVSINNGGTPIFAGSQYAVNHAGAAQDIIFTAAGASSTLAFYTNSTTAGAGFDYDNVSIKELPGNHALAPNDASRPVLRSRYNLLTYSEQFNNAGWTKQRTTVTANAVTAPDGTTTADTLLETADSGSHGTYQAISKAASSTTYALSSYVKPNGRTWTILQLDSAGEVNHTRVWFNLSGSGTVGSNASAGSGFSFVSASIQALADGWYRCTAVITSDANASATSHIRTATGDTVVSYTGDITKGLYIWGAQILSAADQTSTGGAYQRIAAATDYDTSDPVWRPYLAFDGSDDHMVLASAINITTDMTVVRGFGRSAAGIFSLGLGALTTSTYDALWFTDNRIYQSLTNDLTNFNTAPNTTLGAMVTTSRRSAATETTRLNGTQVNTRAAATVGQSFAYIGLRTTNYNNGPIYGLIVVDRELTGSELTATEQWMAGKTGATLA